MISKKNHNSIRVALPKLFSITNILRLVLKLFYSRTKDIKNAASRLFKHNKLNVMSYIVNYTLMYFDTFVCIMNEMIITDFFYIKLKVEMKVYVNIQYNYLSVHIIYVYYTKNHICIHTNKII